METYSVNLTASAFFIIQIGERKQKKKKKGKKKKHPETQSNLDSLLATWPWDGSKNQFHSHKRG